MDLHSLTGLTGFLTDQTWLFSMGLEAFTQSSGTDNWYWLWNCSFNWGNLRVWPWKCKISIWRKTVRRVAVSYAYMLSWSQHFQIRNAIRTIKSNIAFCLPTFMTVKAVSFHHFMNCRVCIVCLGSVLTEQTWGFKLRPKYVIGTLL